MSDVDTGRNDIITTPNFYIDDFYRDKIKTDLIIDSLLVEPDVFQENADVKISWKVKNRGITNIDIGNRFSVKINLCQKPDCQKGTKRILYS